MRINTNRELSKEQKHEFKRCMRALWNPKKKENRIAIHKM